MTFAQAKGWNIPVLNNTRLSILSLAVVGILMCALSSANTATGTFKTIAMILGVASLLLIIAGLITNNRGIFYLLAADILILWIISTIRHTISA